MVKEVFEGLDPIGCIYVGRHRFSICQEEHSIFRYLKVFEVMYYIKGFVLCKILQMVAILSYRNLTSWKAWIANC